MRRQTLEGCHQTAQYEIGLSDKDMGVTGEKKCTKLWPVNRLKDHSNMKLPMTFS